MLGLGKTFHDYADSYYMFIIFGDCIFQVLQYLLDDVSDFLSTKFTDTKETNVNEDKIGCVNVIKSFIDYLSDRERENFRARRYENENSVTLTTIHQVFSIKQSYIFGLLSSPLCVVYELTVFGLI